ncbi:Protein STU1, partial [Lachnellula willkommii]
MGEKITEEQVETLLAILRTDASNDAKVHQINNVKSGIKQNNVPEACVLPLFEATRSSMISQHAAIVNAGFSTLNHLLTRLSRQEPKYISREAGRTLPLVIEKMGDQKEKYRQLAAQCLTTFWKAVPMDVERVVKSSGLMHQDHGMPFKSFVSTLMDLLEDADGMVRDTARNSVIVLFQDAPNAAKSDLKKQLKNFNVRPTIVAAITSHLAPGGPPDKVEPEIEEAPVRPHFANSVSSMSSVRPATPVTEVKVEKVDPSYVNTLRELEDTFRDMYPVFEGKESEANWLKREQNCTKLRRLNAGNATSDFHEAFLAGVKGLLDGILKAVNSLRTSLSKEGCSLIQELARTVGPGLDPMVELLLQNLVKLCGGTKKISSQNGNVTVDIIISKVSYNLRILQHIWLACQDKNVQPRTYASAWLKTLLKKESHHKNHIEHTGGLDLIEKCIKKGLADANPSKRKFSRILTSVAKPDMIFSIMDTIDATQQKLLRNAPDNPHSPKKAEPVAARPGLGFSKSTAGPPKPSLKETIMLAQKNKAAMANKNLQARPGSAMSSFSPVRTVSSSSNASTSSDAPVRGPRPESTTVSHGGLSVAPMRRAKIRPAPKPELIVRPATAGPYSVRRPAHAPTNNDTGTSPTATRKTRAPSASLAEPQASKPPKLDSSDDEELVTPSKPLQVYEDPFSSTDDQTTPRPTITAPVLEEVAVNEDAMNLVRAEINGAESIKAPPMSPERFKQSSRLLDSGIAKIKTKSLDVHGFRKLQGMIRDNKAAWSEDKFDILLLGLFEYLEAPLASLSPEKVQDVKAQILATIKLMYKKERDGFRPHVVKGLESILVTRSCYDSRAHIVSGLELLADELVTLSEPKQTTAMITTTLQNEQMTLEGCRTLSMGLHVLKEIIEAKKDFAPNDGEVNEMCKLAARCLESSESGVRLDAVQLCVSVNARIGENRFWAALGGVKDDPKSLITYYIVKRQREVAA